MPFVNYRAAYKFLVVKAVLDGQSLDDFNIQNNTTVSDDSLRRWTNLYEKTRSVVCNPATYATSGRPFSLSDEERRFLLALVTADPTIYLEEIQQSLLVNLNIHVSRQTISNELHNRLRMSRKTMQKVHPRQDICKRGAYVGFIAHHSPQSLVFTDECGICSDGVRRTMGWAPVGERTSRMPVERARHRFNVIPAVALDGLVTALVQEDNMCRDGYEFYLEHILLPMMNPFPGPRSVLVLDNASFHHNGRIPDLVEARGCRVVYLPPYSPDMNPIEKGFSVLKASLRRYGHLDGSVDDGEIIESHVRYVFTASLMRKLFRGCGYIE
ncbi:hypothetical protein PGT21_050316 [Puccinia graminis f. sp. tritici]|uniref:Tc1-like transposase DDE domain-containing protein n=1 Tax=Puccinia graminis f. sp. tritici TaxID=56615 RepID=A0A5B0M6J7_PUCGR|nr:hypothetical protein PGT21_050316 [Puccinia graminis f. sp. tritici]